jgi:hypothetical protein
MVESEARRGKGHSEEKRKEKYDTMAFIIRGSLAPTGNNTDSSK